MKLPWTAKAPRAGLVVCIAAGSVVVGAHVAEAAHTSCDDEGVASGDVGNDFGPGTLFVGVDAVGDPSVCVTTGAPLTPANESVTANVEDPNPTTPGVTVGVDRRTCTDQAGTSCTTTGLVGQTGVEDPGAAPTPDLPGGGTAGLGIAVSSDCLWINGTPSCGDGSTLSVLAWEGEGPTTAQAGCLVDAPPNAGCDVQGVRISAFETPNPVLRVSRTGVPGVPDGNTDANPDPACLGIGTTCP